MTGAFGNIGESSLLALFSKGYDIRCFDLFTKNNEKKQKQLSRRGKFETVWGDIQEKIYLEPIFEGVDCVIHLAGIIPPLSEQKPTLARGVNLEGTRNMLEVAEGQEQVPKFIFAGSVSAFGPTMHLQPPRTINDPLIATDTYTETKIECEKLVRASSLPWTILRFAAAPPMNVGTNIDPILFEIPLDQRIEFVHSRDVGLACANAVEADTVGKTLLIGGGKSGQMLQREFLSKFMEAMGMEMPPDSAFKIATKPEEYFYTDWLDTEESQRLLKFQTRTFDQYLEEMKSMMGMKRHIAKLFKGQAMKRILDASPYYSGVDH
ncbi:MAG: NAD(P)-dependent oxidoreductase [Candidatus Thorarchaeota archaeon]|nr:NAD(P)-dependent oxidoreductase [Candidatus Thorarchaeota archaeon]